MLEHILTCKSSSQMLGIGPILWAVSAMRGEASRCMSLGMSNVMRNSSLHRASGFASLPRVLVELCPLPNGHISHSLAIYRSGGPVRLAFVNLF